LLHILDSCKRFGLAAMHHFGFYLLTAVGVSAARERVFSVADLHGDYERFKMILERLDLATFAEDQARWTGGTSILVSTGDSVDRGEHGRAIYLAFQELARQAPGHGGEVLNLIGNHELMNLQADLRYVHRSEMLSTGDYGGRVQREKEWGRDGLIGGDIRNRFITAAVRGRTLFVHGGLDPDVLSHYGSDAQALDALNAQVKELVNVDVVGRHWLFGDNGPFWNRFFADGRERHACDKVERTLSMVGADRMVVGHTPQDNGVNIRCAGRIILADTIISRAYEASFGFSRASAIEYDGGAATALYFPVGQDGVERVPLTPANRSEF